MQMAKTRSTLDQLAPLLGTWEMRSRRYPDGRGRMTMKMLEEGAFARMQSDEEQGLFPTSTWIIGADDAEDSLYAVTHDNRGVSRVYRMTVGGGVWRIRRPAPDFCQRFTGILSDGGKTIAGQWEFSRDGSSWETDFDLVYRKAD